MGSRWPLGKDESRVSVEPMMTPMSRVFRTPINWLWPGRIVKDNLTLLVGNPGVGKSLVAMDLAARLSRGKDWPDGERNPNPAGTVWLKTEDNLHYSIEPALEQAGADLKMIESLDGVRIQGKSGTRHRAFELSRDFDVLAKAIQRVRNCMLVVIDPLAAFLTGRGNPRDTLTALAGLAESMHVAIVAVTHLKAGGREAIHRTTGAFDLMSAARAVWLLTRDPANRERRLALPVKNNLAGEGGGMAYRLCIAAGRAPVVEWLEKDVAMTADEALLGMRPCGPEAERCEEAKTYLRYALAGGPRLVKEIEAEAWRMCRIRKRTLERARKELEVEATRESHRGRWWLRLPEEKTSACAGDGGLGGVGGVMKNREENEGFQSATRPPNGGVGDEAESPTKNAEEQNNCRDERNAENAGGAEPE